MLSLEIDDSEAQTKRVMEKQAQTLGRNIKPDDSIYLDWQDFQRLLRMSAIRTSSCRSLKRSPT